MSLVSSCVVPLVYFVFPPVLGVLARRQTHQAQPLGQWVFSDSYMEAAAARMGLGIAYVPEDLVLEDLEQGRLVRVLKSFSHRFAGLHLYYPHRNVCGLEWW